MPDRFVGRKEELDCIGDLIANESSSVVLVSGPGGIGKTRFLDRIHEVFRVFDSATVVPRLDLDDLRLRIKHAIERRIAGLDDVFAPYHRKYDDYVKLVKTAQTVDLSSRKLEQESEELTETFLHYLGQFGQQERVVILFDTLEKVQQDTAVWPYILDLVHRCQVTLVVMAGRECASIKKELEAFPNAKRCELLNLQPFSPDETEEFVRSSVPIESLPDEKLTQKISLLSGGRPILIELALKWVERHVRIPELEETSLEELRNLDVDALQRRQELFERALVENFLQLEDPDSWAILCIAYAQYPFLPDVLTKVSDLSLEESAETLERIKSAGFVKLLPDGSVILHDEMVRLVNKHVWGAYDPSGRQRKKLSEDLVDYFDSALGDIHRQLEKEVTPPQAFLLREEEEILQQKRLYHALRWDFHVALDSFEQLFDQKIEKNRTTLCERLLKEIDEYVEESCRTLVEDTVYSIEFRRARLFDELGRRVEAVELLKKLLEEYGHNPAREREISNRLSGANYRAGNLDAAKKWGIRTIELNEQFGDMSSKMHNAMGMYHRISGHLTDALQYYERSLQISKQTENQPGIAEALHSMAFVYMLKGKYDSAVDLITRALDIRRSLLPAQQKAGVMRGYLTLGTILTLKTANSLGRKGRPEDKGKFQEALSYLEDALRIADELEDHEWRARVKFRLGFIYMFLGEERDREPLEIARGYYQESIDICQKYGYDFYLPVPLHQISHVYLYLGEMEKARQINRESHQKAVNVHHIRYMIDSLVAKAEFDFEDGVYDSIREYARQLQEDYVDKGFEYPLYYGRMRRILADLAFLEQDYETALQNYLEALRIIAPHGGFGVYCFANELKNFEEKASELVPEVALQWFKQLANTWDEHGLYETRPEVKWTCVVHGVPIQG